MCIPVYLSTSLVVILLVRRTKGLQLFCFGPLNRLKLVAKNAVLKKKKKLHNAHQSGLRCFEPPSWKKAKQVWLMIYQFSYALHVLQQAPPLKLQ